MDVKITTFFLIALLANFASAEMVPITEMRTTGGFPGTDFQHRYITDTKEIEELYNLNAGDNSMSPMGIIGYISDKKENDTVPLLAAVATNYNIHPYILNRVRGGPNRHQITYTDQNKTAQFDQGPWSIGEPLGWIKTVPGDGLVPLYIYDGRVTEYKPDQILSTDYVPYMIRYGTFYTNHGLLGYVISKENSIETKPEQGQISKLFSYIWGVIT